VVCRLWWQGYAGWIGGLPVAVLEGWQRGGCEAGHRRADVGGRGGEQRALGRVLEGVLNEACRGR
jgi:hypothetical protein